jgi:hypothetical protein
MAFTLGNERDLTSREKSHYNAKNRTTQKTSICPTTITHIYRHEMVSTEITLQVAETTDNIFRDLFSVSIGVTVTGAQHASRTGMELVPW